MRYGIVSDVHGNLEALEVVFEHLAGERIDKYVFLGDAVGYGANPDEVCDLLREKVEFAVVGNHDAALTRRIDYSDYYEAARHGIDWCRERLSSENYEWLKNLPYTQRDGDILFSHGAPVAPELFDYLFSAEQVFEMMDGLEELPPVTFIGHSHLTIAFRIKHDDVMPLSAHVIECDPAAQYIITAGSVGQPRDRNPKTCCGIYDAEARTFAFRRLKYDQLKTRQKIIDAGLAQIFGDRLLVGI
jgi:predicted phosphodiesterase